MRWMMLGAALLFGAAVAGCGDSGTATAPAGGGGGTPVAATDTATVDKLIADTTDYIKTNKWDLADKGMKQLEDMKPKLSPENAKRVDELKSMYDSAKATAGKTPAMSMPKTP